MSKYIQAWVGFRKPMVMRRKMKRVGGHRPPRFQTTANRFSWPGPQQHGPPGAALGGKSLWVERCPKMKVQRERGCKTASVQVSNFTIAGSNSLRGARTWDRGKEGGLGANSCLDNLSSKEQIRPTTFFGTNQAEEEKLEGEASLLVTAFANYPFCCFPFSPAPACP